MSLPKPSGSSPDEHRALLAGLRGTVLEIGSNTGESFASYPSSIEALIAIEPDERGRSALRAAARRAPVRVQVLHATAEALPIADATIDAVVSSRTLCAVPDQARALAELRRVLRPGGELRFIEHVVAHPVAAALVQALADRTGLWPWISGAGCFCSRDTVRAIERAGFEIERTRRRLDVSGLRGVLNAPHVAGVARRV